MDTPPVEGDSCGRLCPSSVTLLYMLCDDTTTLCDVFQSMFCSQTCFCGCALGTPVLLVALPSKTQGHTQGWCPVPKAQPQTGGQLSLMQQ